LLYVSGQGPFGGDDGDGVGVVGGSLSLEQGRSAARLAALNMLAAVKSELGTLSGLTRVVKLSVFVRCSSGFGLEHLVADGASALLEEVIGPDGLGARSAIGVADLPFGICVELEGIVEVGT
jgi:enamine deaminase RidA (YjgF/YER057c/UK114 family)